MLKIDPFNIINNISISYLLILGNGGVHGLGLLDKAMAEQALLCGPGQPQLDPHTMY